MDATKFPLPKEEGTFAMYWIEDPQKGRTYLASIERRPKSYYGDAEEFDFEARTADEMRAKLARWNAKHVGWEHGPDDDYEYEPPEPDEHCDEDWL